MLYDIESYFKKQGRMREKLMETEYQRLGKFHMPDGFRGR